MQSNTILVKEDRFRRVFEEALLIKRQADLETAEEVVYDANLAGYLPDADSLYILNRLNGYL